MITPPDPRLSAPSEEPEDAPGIVGEIHPEDRRRQAARERPDAYRPPTALSRIERVVEAVAGTIAAVGEKAERYLPVIRRVWRWVQK